MVVLVAAVTVACAPPAADQSAELAALTDNWENALNASDIDSLAALYAEDCVLMPPNAELMTGRGAASELFGEMIGADLSGELDTITAVAAGGVGYHVGTYSLRDVDGNVVDRGKFIEGWQKIGGEWLIVHDIWNSDLAPGAAATTLVVTHDVEDADHWLEAWQGEDSRRGMFAEHGAPHVRVFQSPDEPNQTGLLIDVIDMAAFEAMLSSAEGAAAKAEDGVVDSSMRVYVEMD
jgi:ketosteroid isomerase-like protein